MSRQSPLRADRREPLSSSPPPATLFIRVLSVPAVPGLSYRQNRGMPARLSSMSAEAPHAPSPCTQNSLATLLWTRVWVHNTSPPCVVHSGRGRNSGLCTQIDVFTRLCTRVGVHNATPPRCALESGCAASQERPRRTGAMECDSEWRVSQRASQQRVPYATPSGCGPAARTSGLMVWRRFSALSTNICASLSAVSS